MSKRPDPCWCRCSSAARAGEPVPRDIKGARHVDFFTGRRLRHGCYERAVFTHLGPLSSGALCVEAVVYGEVPPERAPA